jgi:subtilisin family serine protease
MKGSMVMVVALDKNQTDLAWRFSNMAGLSNVASQYVVAAPGEEIVANGAGDKPIIMSGTSMAAPFVTGLTASIMAQYQLSSHEALKCILDSAKTENEFQKRLFGRGIVMKDDAQELAKAVALKKKNPKNLGDKPSPVIWNWGVELEPSSAVRARFEVLNSK